MCSGKIFDFDLSFNFVDRLSIGIGCPPTFVLGSKEDEKQKS